MPRKKLTTQDPVLEEQRQLALSDLTEYAKLMMPKLCLGSIHHEVVRWWDRPGHSRNQLLLLPREHLKSTLLALRIAQRIHRDPTSRILLLSSTSNLAVKQLKLIKDILTCSNARLLWPEMVNREEAKREKWTEREISVDHPLRKEWAIREPTIFTAGLTTNIVGLHCDVAALDDIVVESNAYNESGREKVSDQYGYLAAVETTGSEQWVAGTRYHPLDQYSKMMLMEIKKYDELGNVFLRTPLFEVFERQVESIGNGYGEFLWPRQLGPDGKWFGFDSDILAEKRTKFENQLHFRAQYYNDPHDTDNAPIKRDQFQYYKREFINNKSGRWYFKDEYLNVAAAVDFAYSLGKRSDFSAIVVVGLDAKGNYYVLDIDRFKTDRPSEYFNRILKLYNYWGFRKIRAEVSAAQIVLVKDLKESYIKPNGLALSVEEYRPSRWEGSKEERILSVLEPKYANGQMWHYTGGHCQSLEEELIFQNPPHDDIKDALASACDFVKAPGTLFSTFRKAVPNFSFHSRFGGVT